MHSHSSHMDERLLKRLFEAYSNDLLYYAQYLVRSREEAEEIVDVNYQGTEMEIGFNVSYILDVLNALKSENVTLFLTDAVSSVQIEDSASSAAVYVVMPMRL